MIIERISTGVEGLDNKMEGGLVKGSVSLITGKTGTGKTAFCASFLYSGALKGEPGLYVTTEERDEDIKNDIAAMFGWNFQSLEERGLIKFLPIRPQIPESVATGEDLGRYIKLYVFQILGMIERAIREANARRVVLDSVSIIEMFIKDEYLCRVAIVQLMDKLKELGVTSLVTGTVPETSESLSGGGIVEFIADAVIKLDFVPVAEEFKRTINIRKMRRTDHSIYIHPFDISKTGLRIIELH
jgi:circadian clock protein KaiC